MGGAFGPIGLGAKCPALAWPDSFQANHIMHLEQGATFGTSLALVPAMCRTRNLSLAVGSACIMAMRYLGLHSGPCGMFLTLSEVSTRVSRAPTL